MSEPSLKPTVTSSIRRWNIGATALLHAVLWVVIVIGVNYLASQHVWRWDLSRAEDYSISNWTKGLLQQPALQQREKPVKLIVSFRRSNPFNERVRAMIDEYVRQSNRKIVIERLDPVRDVDRAQQLAQVYNLAANAAVMTREDLVLIDARQQTDEPVNKDTAAQVRFVTLEAMLRYENNDGKTARRVAAFQGEDALSTGLLAALEGKPRWVYFLADKSDFHTDSEVGSWPNMRDLLLSQNIVPVPIQISEVTAIPPNAAGLIIAAPRYDFTKEEMQRVLDYWNRPNSNIMVILHGEQVPDRLRGFLRDHGVTPRRDQVVTVKNNSLLTRVDASFVAGPDLTKDLINKTTGFEGATCSLDVRENAEDLINRRIAPIKLLDALESYWGETQRGSKLPSYDPAEDHRGPVTVAAAVIRGAASDDRFSAEASRMVVIGNANFLEPTAMREENIDFFRAAENWLVGREQLLGTGPRHLATYKLPLLSSQSAWINRFNVFFLPMGAVVIALWVWNARRA